MLSIATDYISSQGSAYNNLKEISEAGFSHIHWCHQWNTDFLYSKYEIAEIKKWLKEFNLKLCDLHASAGKEKKWTSKVEYERLSGIELVKNRMEMTATLGSDVIVLHAGSEYSEQLKTSLEELLRYAEEINVKIACENTGNQPILKQLLDNYNNEFLGLCYDSGHGNMLPGNEGLEFLNEYKDRLISVHLHDNNGLSDEHKLPFSGTLDWNILAQLMKGSSYKKPVSMEVSMKKSGFEDSKEFLKTAFETGTKLTKMIVEN